MVKKLVDLKNYSEHLAHRTNDLRTRVMTSNHYRGALIMTAKEVKEEFENNECFSTCQGINQSKYNFYVDMETGEYFASLKNRLEDK